MNRTRFILVLILLLLTVVIGSLAISASFAFVFNFAPLWFNQLIWIAPTFLTLTFVGAQFASAKFFNTFTRTVYTITASWMGFFVYFLLASIVFGLLAMIEAHTSLDLPYMTIGLYIVLAACALGVYGLLNAEKIKVTEISVSLPRLPEVWKNRTAVFVSDVHLGQIHNTGYVQKVVRNILKLKPDIVFIGGDLFDGSVPAVPPTITPLRELTAPLGVYYVTGNHEEFGPNDAFVSAVKSAGITVLDNEYVDVEGLQIVGVSYTRAEEETKFRELLTTIPFDKNKPTILLKHEPKDIHVAEAAGISLQLSGHTHHAQVWPFRFIPKRIYKGFDYGLKKYKAMHVYTSSGVGTWGPPVRVGTQSEIVSIKMVY
jgi:predicted MPP superfamily phosphohydrolase